MILLDRRFKYRSMPLCVVAVISLDRDHIGRADPRMGMGVGRYLELTMLRISANKLRQSNAKTTGSCNDLSIKIHDNTTIKVSRLVGLEMSLGAKRLNGLNDWNDFNPFSRVLPFAEITAMVKM